MRKTFVLPSVAVFIAVLFTVVFIACRKTNQQQDQQPVLATQASNNFFLVSPGTDYILHAVAKKISKQDEQHPFVQSLVKRVGYPEWDHSLIADGPGHPRPAVKRGNTEIKNDQRVILYIPFAKEEERKTKAVLRVVIVKADTSFEMLYPQHYKKYGFNKHTATSWNAQDLFNVFANFDHELFGTSKFLVKDGRIFGKEKSDWLIVERKMKEEVASDNTLAARMSSITVCAYTTACVYASDNPYDGGNCVTTVSCTDYWYDDVTGSGSNTGGGSPVVNGGGGNGDGSWTGDPCNTQPVVQRPAEPLPPSTPPDPGSDCGDEPWEPDDIINGVKDPCLKAMVQEAINKDCNNKVSSFINTTFDNNTKIDLLFRDAPLGNYLAEDGNSNCFDFPLTGYAKVIITLNSSHGSLPAASKEYIVATIFHEAIHAWIEMTSSKYGASNTISHETMTNSSNISLLASALMEIYPGIPLQDARDLAWGGLESTAAWSSLSSAERDRITKTNTAYRNQTKGHPCTY